MMNSAFAGNPALQQQMTAMMPQVGVTFGVVTLSGAESIFFSPVYLFVSVKYTESKNGIDFLTRVSANLL